MRALHNSYFLKEDGLFFSSKALGLVFLCDLSMGEFCPLRIAPINLGLRFPPLISCEKTAAFDSAELVAGHQSLQKSPPSSLG